MTGAGTQQGDEPTSLSDFLRSVATGAHTRRGIRHHRPVVAARASAWLPPDKWIHRLGAGGYGLAVPLPPADAARRASIIANFQKFAIIVSATVFCFAQGGAMIAEAFPAPGEWVCYRGNPTLDGRSRAKGRLTQPRLAWKHFVG